MMVVIDFEVWRAERAPVRPPEATRPFLGRPVISSRRCSNCGTALLGFPKWREAPREDCKRATDEGCGWIEFEEACAYGCFSATHLGVETQE
jgi:hypothetical protein